MTWRILAALGALLLGTMVARGDSPDRAAGADIVLLGELHDNPAHHTTQAEWVAALRPTVLVVEMITAETAEALKPAARATSEEMAHALDWAASGWPDFALYWPIFAAAPDAALFGAGLPRDAARAALQTGGAAFFGQESAALYGLSDPLPQAEQAKREALQMAAHCDALPMDMLAGMVAIQRLRDALLARAATKALATHGPPVIVITGNGHARSDWGVPRYLRRVAPEAQVFSLGQTEDGRPLDGTFDAILDAPPVERGDPCAAFRSN